MSSATYTPAFGSRLCAEQLPTVAGILGEGTRYELLKLEQRFPEAKELWPSQFVPFCVLCGSISVPALPSPPLAAWHSPFRWCNLYFGHITAEVLLQ